MIDAAGLARELAVACAGRRPIAPLSSRIPEFDLTAAYAVEHELVALRRASGHEPIGRKIGYANKALWRVLKLETVAWAHVYDDTVQYARGGGASISIGRMFSPKIEPEILFKLKSDVERPFRDRNSEPADVLDACEWIALGFEIIDCRFPDW